MSCFGKKDHFKCSWYQNRFLNYPSACCSHKHTVQAAGSSRDNQWTPLCFLTKVSSLSCVWARLSHMFCAFTCPDTGVITATTESQSQNYHFPWLQVFIKDRLLFLEAIVWTLHHQLPLLSDNSLQHPSITQVSEPITTLGCTHQSWKCITYQQCGI